MIQKYNLIIEKNKNMTLQIVRNLENLEINKFS